MKTMNIFKLAAYMLAAVLAVSCTYPFYIVGDDVETTLVVDGNIYIGEVCTFNVSYLKPLGGSKDSKYANPNCFVMVEADNGTTYNSSGDPKSGYKVDLTGAPADAGYRLWIRNSDNGKEYYSDWQKPLPSAAIDDLGYMPNEEKGFMAITLSMHGNGEKHFRWTYDEIWEYTSDIRAFYYYQPPWNGSAYNDFGSVYEYRNGENSFYCWNNQSSKEILIFDTSDQTEDRFVDLEFRKIPRDDKRLQVMYYIKVRLEALSDSGYAYWDNVQRNSTMQDNIFAPTPSEYRGNIRCSSDPEEMVYGYVNVAQRTEAELFIDNKETFFYEGHTYVQEPEFHNQNEWYALYRAGMVPVDAVLDESGLVITGYTWAEKRCVDCTSAGGTKDKPDFWPNDHK